MSSEWLEGGWLVGEGRGGGQAACHFLFICTPLLNKLAREGQPDSSHSHLIPWVIDFQAFFCGGHQCGVPPAGHHACTPPWLVSVQLRWVSHL